jgi:hypothetical protein
MGNALQGTAEFIFEGSSYGLTLNNKVMLDAERVLGYSALDAAEEAKQALAMGRNPMLRTVIAIFYGALVQNHPAISQDEAIDMFMDCPAAQKAFADALQGSEMPLGKRQAAASKALKAARAPRAAKAKKRPGIGKKSIKAGGKPVSQGKISG